MIVVIDYDIGNIGSIVNMLKKIGSKVIVTSDHNIINNAKKIILPGVGSFDNGMKKLNEYGLIEILHQKVIREKTKILGICLGAQLMAKKSDEGNLDGLGWLDIENVRFKSDHETNIRIPHMGWNYIEKKKNSNILKYVDDNARFYFVHSYHFVCHNSTHILTETKYGNKFTSAFEHENIYGVQFHPEKSHSFGMSLLKSFIEIDNQK